MRSHESNVTVFHDEFFTRFRFDDPITVCNGESLRIREAGMKAGEYQRAARSTAIYPAGAGVFYPALGLAGEAGEIANKVKKIIRGDVTFEQRRDELRAELGDVMWYVAGTASDLGMELKALANDAADNGKQLTGDLYSTVLKLNAFAGRVADVSEEIRTQGLTFIRRAAIESALVFVLRACARLAAILGVELADVCRENAEKVLKRQAGGVIKGDGDKR